MAYDEELAERVRELVGAERGLAEKKMFGGLAFLLDGNMAVGVSGQGGLLVRVDPAAGDELVATTAAEPMEMQGRQMSGWLRVGSDAVGTKKELTAWVSRGVGYARTLPPKKSQAAGRPSSWADRARGAASPATGAPPRCSSAASSRA